MTAPPSQSSPPDDRLPENGPQSAFLVGAAGAGMRAAGEYLRDLGVRVAATDRDVSALRPWADANGVRVVDGSMPSLRADLLIHTAAVPPDHPAIVATAAPQTHVWSYPQWLGDVSRGRPCVAVAGTHGKTTTAAVLRTALGDASFLIGGADRDSGRSGRAAGGPLVVEACEYRRHFLAMRPAAACLLAAEWDHPDAFDSAGDVREAMRQFRDCVAGPVIAHHSYGWPDRTFGTDSAANLRVTRDRRSLDAAFSLRVDGVAAGPFHVPNLGRHLWMNAAAAVAMALELGVAADDVRRRVAAFAGVQRRLEVFDEGPITWVDDYAHHPTAVAATLRECRRLAGGRRLVVAFEPHQASRLRAFETAFAGALSLADEVFLAPVHAAREAPDGGRGLRALSDRLGPAALVCRDLDHLAGLLQTRRAATGAAVIAVLGAGQIGRLLDERFPHLRDRRAIRGDHADGRLAGPLHVAEGRRPRAVPR